MMQCYVPKLELVKAKYWNFKNQEVVRNPPVPGGRRTEELLQK
jgi:hypothetical protein